MLAPGACARPPAPVVSSPEVAVHAAQLPLAAIRRDMIGGRGGCSWVEDFATEIPERRLETAAGGLAVTFVAGSGENKTIAVTPRQVGVQRAAIAAVRRLLCAAAPPADPAARLMSPG